jgi:uncharacterized integral membrane protein
LKPKLIVFLIVAVIAIIVLAQNTQEIVLYFLFWSARTTQIFLILIMLIFGFVMGFIVGKLTGRKK